MQLGLVTVTFCDINVVWCYVFSQAPLLPDFNHPPPPPPGKSGFKLVCNVNIVYENLLTFYKLQVWELSRLCPETSTKLYVHNFGFCCGESYTVQIRCPRVSVDTEFRLFFLLPSILYSVRNCLKYRGISRNSMLYNKEKFRGISQNSVIFFMYGIPYISKETHIK